MSRRKKRGEVWSARKAVRGMSVADVYPGLMGVCARKAGAGEGNRTLIMSLGSSGPAIERRPLYISHCQSTNFLAK